MDPFLIEKPQGADCRARLIDGLTFFLTLILLIIKFYIYPKQGETALSKPKLKPLPLVESNEILVEFFKGLGDSTRLGIIEDLLDKERNVSDLIQFGSDLHCCNKDFRLSYESGSSALE